MRNKAGLVFCVLIVALLGSCQSEEDRQLEAIDYSLKINRLDSVMKAYAHAAQNENAPSTVQQFRNFFGSYLDFIRFWNYFSDSTISDTLIANDFHGFLLDMPVQALLDTIHKHYPDNDAFKPFEKAIKRLKLYFNDFAYPEIYTYITGYPPADVPPAIVLERDQLIVSEKYWGISLDYFLGKDADYHLDLPMYIRRKCRKEYILPAILMRYIGRWQPPLQPEKMPTFLDRVIHQGIKLYFTQRISPETPDSILLAYTPENLEWAHYYEKNIYNELLPYFFKTDPKANEKYLMDKPFTQGLDRQSPGRLGEFLGLKIVQSFMKNNPDVSLAELVKMTDYAKILKLSRYKP